MPVTELFIFPPIDNSFWDTIDPDNSKQVLEAVKYAFDRPEPAYEMHMVGNMGGGANGTECLEDCLVFLLCGKFGVRSQPEVCYAETGCAYRVKNETMLEFHPGPPTTVVIMEEGEMKGQCLRMTEESVRMYRAMDEGNWWQRRKARKAYDKRFYEEMARIGAL